VSARSASACFAAFLALSCASPQEGASRAAAQAARNAYADARARLVESLRRQGIRDVRVLEAIGRVPRHLFVPEAQRAHAYENRPLPIGYEQTISQPYVVAVMTELVEVRPPCKVLEIGTGSGYQAAVLAELGCDVFSIEILEPLASQARERLAALGYARVRVRAGDGYLGWPEEAPFDAIVITAAPPDLPEPLLPQLRVGGRLVAPIGETSGAQELVVVTRTESDFERRSVLPVRFVPMTGQAQDRRGR
jgi:protein-L-isoaspartate(D-aspartate) O-methyltransferase